MGLPVLYWGDYNFDKKIERWAQTAAADNSPNDPLEIEMIADHVAAYLQGAMLLTLRLISTDATMNVSADNQSACGTGEHSSTWAGSGGHDSYRDTDNIEWSLAVWW